jgi:hypothetical protein
VTHNDEGAAYEDRVACRPEPERLSLVNVRISVNTLQQLINYQQQQDKQRRN